MSISIPQDKLGEVTVSISFIIAGVIKWISEVREAKEKKKEEESPEKKELKVKVITGEEFLSIMEELKELKGSKELTRTSVMDSFQDVLACTGIINILLQALATDRRKILLNVAAQEVYVFLRHMEFPSRMLITSIFELAVKEANKLVEEKEGEERDGSMDTGTD